jgi:seryl-tRNA(Sec) selenium transferase
MKAGKEEIVGLVKAIELYYQKDHAAEMALWYGRIETIESALSHLTGIRLERRMPAGIGCQIPFLSVSWDESELGKTHRSVVDELEKGDPPIVVTLVGPESPRVVRPELWFLVHSLQDREAELVAHCIREILATFSKC